MSARRRRRKPETRDWRTPFLQALRDVGIVRLACQAAGMPRQTVYDHRARDEAFAKAWDEALEEATDLLEEEARRRAVEGVQKPVYHKGEQIDVVKSYSDTLLIFLLKAARPGKYRDNVHHEVTGKDGGPIRIRAEDLTDDQLAHIATGGGPASPGPA